MAEFQKWLRHELQSAGIPATTVARVETALSRQWGGERVYVGRIPEERRERVQSLIRAGMPPRTAQWKCRP